MTGEQGSAALIIGQPLLPVAGRSRASGREHNDPAALNGSSNVWGEATWIAISMTRLSNPTVSMTA